MICSLKFKISLCRKRRAIKGLCRSKFTSIARAISALACKRFLDKLCRHSQSSDDRASLEKFLRELRTFIGMIVAVSLWSVKGETWVHQLLQLEKWSVQLAQNVKYYSYDTYIYTYIDQLASCIFSSSCIWKNRICMIGYCYFLSSFRSFFICISKNLISLKIKGLVFLPYTFQS